MPDLNSSLKKFSSALDRILSHKIDPNSKEKTNILDFSQKKKSYYISDYQASFKELCSDLSETGQKTLILDLKEAFGENNLDELKKILSKIIPTTKKISSPTSSTSLSFKIKNIPEEISDEINQDLKELEKCFASDCFRASVILCGRILETSLHRKYYEKTNNDLLEKAPGIGLGNVIAKMKEKNIELDPAIAQQIHLINQVRIYSVHKKQKPFSPSKEQTHAIILYTLDVVRKLFP